MKRTVALSILVLGACGRTDLCPEPSGALLLEQLYLSGPALNEAMVVTLPSGGHLLIDVGNDSRYDQVRDALAGPTEWVLITHQHQDHMGALDELEGHWEDLGQAPTFIDGVGIWALGDGVELELFKHGCELATPDGVVDLCAVLPGMDQEENAMSSAGVLRYGAFAYLFAGDLSGGGSDSVDVETAIADQGLALGAVDVAHISHHGKQSSTNQAWVDLFFPDDGHARNAVVGASAAYLAAPHEDVLDRLGSRLAGGWVWVTADGVLAGDHDNKRTLDADVVISVDPGGGSYAICGELFDAIP